MWGRTPKPTDRHRPRRHTGVLEWLEPRALLTGPPAFGRLFAPSFRPPRTVSHFSPPLNLSLPVGSDPHILAQLDNDGRNISGKDREGDEYFITVHGPGVVIVTDATPNDGVLDDDIDTIRIVGAHPRKTYVTGQVVASSRVITDGTVKFNRLISENGVRSIILNGFNLTNTVPPPYEGQPLNVGPEIYLPGGVSVLQFNNIETFIDTNSNDQPFEIVIGHPTTPLRQRPHLKIGRIFNTVAAADGSPIPNGTPRTDPTVNFLVNGGTGKFEAVSISRRPVLDPGLEYNEPVVSATGRTALRTKAADLVKVYGSARNFVVSRAGRPAQPQNGEPGIPIPTAPTTQPFQSPFSGLRRLRRAEFGGPTDAVGLDVDGPIGTLRFRRGIGDPTGAVPGQTNLGFNAAQQGYPSFGLLGGQIRASRIHHLGVGPNRLVLQTPQDPDLMQLGRKGSTTFFARPGQALTSVAITTTGSIDDVHIVGDSTNSQIAAGFDYKSYIAGLDPTRTPSAIRRFKQRGNLVDSVVSASYTPGPDGDYPGVTPTSGNDDIVGPGGVRGRLTGFRFYAGGTTALNYRGAGVFARRKDGHLPPPNGPTRRHSVAFRP
ncbi:MAG: hypothetical protein KatS3mg108_1442 [Isosphaeraceae bacterium]|jgi:hypothetical protein|nr:MAG: hypothetical protein KatS3mg108_1442 [Isosphaeraceae bacterium]